MSIKRIARYLNRVKELGLISSWHVLYNKTQRSRFAQHARKKVELGRAQHSWHDITNQEFSVFFENTKKRLVLPFASQLKKYVTQDEDVLCEQADGFVQKTFDLLGSGVQTFSRIPWHSDFRLQQLQPESDSLFDAHSFYADLSISSGTTEDFTKDIKVPWELSRSQHFFVLGQAYQATGKEKYSDAFQEQILDWLDNNPYLCGPNWLCPMDVGIRAINWVWALHFFASAQIDDCAWQRIVCSLYDHMVYLENSWEFYDSRTSNHYLSDLVGYLYCCWLFDGLDGVPAKARWCYREILKEFEKQIFDEGTSYEGSTYYHRLVTELFYHASLLFQEFGFAVSTAFQEKLARMFSFIHACTINKNELIQIGDNDSGKILYWGITPELVDDMRSKESESSIINFFAFGISLLKTNDWHISLRHHAYNRRQPSGHFHNDAGSITIAVNGIPVIVDPGSYVYTPSVVWRNRFRSVENHNTVFIEGREPVALDDRLFVLDVPQADRSAYCHDAERLPIITHFLYPEFAAQRIVGHKNDTCVITDNWKSAIEDAVRVGWNFTLAPHIDVEQHGGWWHCSYQGTPLIKIGSPDLSLHCVAGWYSPAYGVKQETKQLRGWSVAPVAAMVRTVVKKL